MVLFCVFILCINGDQPISSIHYKLLLVLYGDDNSPLFSFSSPLFCFILYFICNPLML